MWMRLFKAFLRHPRDHPNHTLETTKRPKPNHKPTSTFSVKCFIFSSSSRFHFSLMPRRNSSVFASVLDRSDFSADSASFSFCHREKKKIFFHLKAVPLMRTDVQVLRAKSFQSEPDLTLTTFWKNFLFIHVCYKKLIARILSFFPYYPYWILSQIFLTGRICHLGT